MAEEGTTYSLHHVLSKCGYSLRRHFVDKFLFQHIPFLPGGSLVLDVGGMRNARRGLFDISAYDLRVVYANVSPEHGADVLGDASALPFADAAFEYAICSEVLEHVFRPNMALSEMARILRPGGKLFATTPFLHRIHPDPDDFGRYTAAFWQRSLSEAGFETIRIESHGFFWSVFAEMLRACLVQFDDAARGRLSLPAGIRRKLVLLARRKALQWDHGQRNSCDSLERTYTTGFGIEAAKKQQEG